MVKPNKTCDGEYQMYRCNVTYVGHAESTSSESHAKKTTDFPSRIILLALIQSIFVTAAAAAAALLERRRARFKHSTTPGLAISPSQARFATTRLVGPIACTKSSPPPTHVHSYIYVANGWEKKNRQILLSEQLSCDSAHIPHRPWRKERTSCPSGSIDFLVLPSGNQAACMPVWGEGFG